MLSYDRLAVSSRRCCHVRCHAKKWLHPEPNVISSNHDGCVTCKECDVTCWKQLCMSLSMCTCLLIYVHVCPLRQKRKLVKAVHSKAVQKLHVTTFLKENWYEIACVDWFQYSFFQQSPALRKAPPNFLCTDTRVWGHITFLSLLGSCSHTW